MADMGYDLVAEHELLKTRYEILEEKHETLKKDYKSLEQRCKFVDDLNKVLNLYVKNPGMAIEKELKEKEEFKKTIKKMKLKVKELLVAKDKKEEELKKMEDKFQELAGKFGEVETESSFLKSLYDAEVGFDQGRKDEVNMVDLQVTNTRTDAGNGVDQGGNNVAGNGVDEGGNEVAIDKEVIVVKEDHNVNNTVKAADNEDNVDSDNDVIMAEEDQNVNNIVSDAGIYTDQGGNDDVIVVGESPAVNNNTATDTIVISDGSDDENENPPRQTNTILFPQRPAGIKQEEGCSKRVASSPKVQNPLYSSSSSSDSSSSEEFVVLPGSMNRSRG